MILHVFKRLFIFAYFITFLKDFLETAYLPIYIQFVCYLDFQKLKRDIENLFSSCHKVNFRKKHILVYFSIFRIFFLKN